MWRKYGGLNRVSIPLEAGDGDIGGVGVTHDAHTHTRMRNIGFRV